MTGGTVVPTCQNFGRLVSSAESERPSQEGLARVCCQAVSGFLSGGGTLEFQPVTNAAQADFQRGFADATGYRNNRILARRQCRDEADDAVGLIGAGRGDDLIAGCDGMIIDRYIDRP